MTIPRLALALLLFAACAACGGSSTSGTGSGTGGTTTTSSSAVGGADAGVIGTGGAAGMMGLGGAVGACSDCGGACVDTANDALHCGACGHACPDQQHCDHGVCKPPSCLVQGPICPSDHLCCGDECCPAWKMCCNVPGGAAPTCVFRDAGACPSTCGSCL